ncbi:MAG: hypothetical protein A3J38_09125 [Gammaproteobacteria bacterium RIFCSPHIGHO2_12_FULL_45_9]|nr:MAG: hypothetical protein A3J38_09125 [Gammaproteobacteria bacterium RIFCSPHIGHO2_12_FULL_45_9]
MTTLSIVLPDTLAKASQEIAKQLGLSRTQFIREAIAHELERIRAFREQKAITHSMAAMKKSPAYLAEAEELTEGLTDTLPDDEDEWWNPKKS